MTALVIYFVAGLGMAIHSYDELSAENKGTVAGIIAAVILGYLWPVWIVLRLVSGHW